MGFWVHLKSFSELMDMRQLFGCGKNSTECLSGCKNIKLQKSHCYSINEIFWNSNSDFSKIVLIFDHFLLLVGWYNVFLLLFMIVIHLQSQNRNLKNFYLQKMLTLLEANYFQMSFYIKILKSSAHKSSLLIVSTLEN